MKEWLFHALRLLDRGEACVLVSVVAAEGSTPREVGTKMLVHAGGIEGSIGGGHLEWKAIERARAMLAGDMPTAEIELLEFALGPSLGQCCGGRLRLMLEPLAACARAWLESWRDAGPDHVLATDLATLAKTVIAPDAEEQPPALSAGIARLMESERPILLADGPGSDGCYVVERMTSQPPDICLFGAGHVGQALVRVLGGLPYRVHWFDGRPDMFPAAIPANIAVEVSHEPRHDVANAPAGAFVLVMTHSHALDFDICDQVLRRGDFAFLGLIGSASKRASFVRRLRARGHSEAAIGRLTCPIGLPGINSKEPAAIAIAVAGQLLALSEAKVAQGKSQLKKARSRA